MILLVTGMAGFIGSNFIYHYLQEHKDRKIIGLDKLTYAGNLANISNLGKEQEERLKFVKGDINDRKLVEEIFANHEIDGVINFAAESHVDRSIHDSRDFLISNILGTQTLIDVAKQFWYKEGSWLDNKKFLQVSTDEVYGSLGRTGLFTEKTPLDPRSPYSASKASADMIVKANFDTFGMPMNITRCSNNYGPYQFPEKLIPLIINNCLNHKPLPVYGDGKQVRDWIYVDDHCRAIDLVYDKAPYGEIYNIGGNNQWENIDIVHKIIEILSETTNDEKISLALIKHVQDRLGHDKRYAMDSSKIERELGWNPSVEFEEGIILTIDWYLQNREWMTEVTSGEYMKFYEKNYETRLVQ